MRAWLLTWTTYGSWLPGDRRGSVTRMREVPGPRRLHNIPGTPYDGPLPELESVAQAALKGSPIFLTLPQAERINTVSRNGRVPRLAPSRIGRDAQSRAPGRRRQRRSDLGRSSANVQKLRPPGAERRLGAA